MENFDFETVVQILTAISLSYQLIEKAVKSIIKVIRRKKRLERDKHKNKYGK